MKSYYDLHGHSDGSTAGHMQHSITIIKTELTDYHVSVHNRWDRISYCTVYGLSFFSSADQGHINSVGLVWCIQVTYSKNQPFTYCLFPELDVQSCYLICECCLFSVNKTLDKLTVDTCW